MIDRSYQPRLIAEAREKLREIQARLTANGITRKPRLMVQLPCGGGKTVLAALIGKSAMDKGGRIAFLCHRNFLQDQTSSTFTDFGIRHSFIAAGKSLNPHAKAHVGMIGSMKSRQSKLKPPTICFVDEGHHGVAKSWKAAIEAWPETTFIFLSATPGERSDGIGLDELCDDIVCGPSVAELIELGALSSYRWLRGQAPAELMALKLRKGDSIEKQGAIMDRAVVIGDIVGTYRREAMGKRAVYFAPTVKCSMDYAEAFRNAGIPFAHMDQSTPSHERRWIAKAIAKGELFGFTNCTIAGEGFDLAAQAGEDVTIDVAGICRRTESLPFLIQMAMRCMRAKPYPGIILDHADCYGLHGWLPDDDITWTLAGAERKPKGIPDIRCPGCHATVSASLAFCPSCQTQLDEEKEREAGVRAEIEHVAGELIEVERARVVAENAAKWERKKTIAELNRADEIIAYGREMKYKDGWARMLIEAKRKKGRLVA